MKKLTPIILSLIVLTVTACSGGYYSHLPRAKTNKTATIDELEKNQDRRCGRSWELKNLDIKLPNNNTTEVKNIIANSKEVVAGSQQSKVVTKKSKSVKSKMVNFYKNHKHTTTAKPIERNASAEMIWMILVMTVLIVLSGFLWGWGCAIYIVLFLLVFGLLTLIAMA